MPGTVLKDSAAYSREPLTATLRPMFHATALVSPRARLGAGVVVGPYCVVEDGAVLGDGVVLQAYVHVHGCATIGARTHVGTGSAIGGEPQDVKYKGEPTTAVIGADCRIHEHVTVHRATGSGTTTVGDNVMLMAGSHVGHNCVVGDRAILTNDAKLAGHVVVGERAILSGGTAVHQFCRVGRLTMLGGGCMINKDAPPFSIVSGALPARWRTPNTIGLRRAGFTVEQRTAIRRALIAILAVPGETRARAEEHLESAHEAVRELARFVLESKRGVVLARRGASRADDPLDAEG